MGEFAELRLEKVPITIEKNEFCFDYSDIFPRP